MTWLKGRDKIIAPQSTLDYHEVTVVREMRLAMFPLIALSLDL